VVQQAHRRDAVEADLRELAGLQDSARWAEARAALERAEARLGGGRGRGPGRGRRPGRGGPGPGGERPARPPGRGGPAGRGACIGRKPTATTRRVLGRRGWDRPTTRRRAWRRT